MGVRRAEKVAGVLLVAALLAGCASGPGQEGSPATSSEPSVSPTTDEASPTADASSTPVDFHLLECAQVIPLGDVQARYSEDAEPFAVEGDPSGMMPDDLASAAMASASEVVPCSWGIPRSDGGFFAFASVLPADARDSLIAGLRTVPYTEEDRDGAKLFSHVETTELGEHAVAYVFVDDVWLSVFGAITESGATDFAWTMLQSLRDANPGWS